MSKTFLISDHHFGHTGVCQFLRDDGTKLRPWDNPNEMNEHLIEKHNLVVSPGDKVYFLGDVCISRKDLKILSRLNGKKILIRGNHDIFKLKDYTEYFYDICGSYKLDNFILSHYPLHPESISRWCLCNIHGHTHYRNILRADGTEDPYYFNVSVENINYTPIEWNYLRDFLTKRLEDSKK